MRGVPGNDDDLDVGCEPVRKDDVGFTITPPHTNWVRAIPVPYFLRKLYEGREYEEGDLVIKLDPPTVSHSSTVAEDPGYIDPNMFDYDETEVPDFYGISEGQTIVDEVLDFLIKELWELYRINNNDTALERAPGQAPVPKKWFDHDSPNDAIVSLHSPIALHAWTRIPGNPSAEDDAPVIEMLSRATYTVMVVHAGQKAESGHYFCAAFNRLTATVYIVDSISTKGKVTGTTSAFVRKLKTVLRKVVPGGEGTNLKFVYPQCEQQTDMASCGLYAVHNAHRLVHAACMDGNFEAVGTDPADMSTLPSLTPEYVRAWRLKLAKAFAEKKRQQSLRVAFSATEDILQTPGYHQDCHPFSVHVPKLNVPPGVRTNLGFGRNNQGVVIRRQGKLPYEEEMVQTERFRPDCVFAQLVEDWQNEDVAGVMIRLSNSKKASKQPTYKAVGWGQTVLISYTPDKGCYNWSFPPENVGDEFCQIATQQEVMETCQKELAKLRKLRPDLKAEELRVHSEYLAGMRCSQTPKMIITPNKDGTTWAKTGWPIRRQVIANSYTLINGEKILKVPDCTMRLPDYAYIQLGAMALKPGQTVKKEARYMWVQKWPYRGFDDPFSNVDLTGAIPYSKPGLWNWWHLEDVIQAKFQTELPDEAFGDLENPYINFTDVKSVPKYVPPKSKATALLPGSKHSGFYRMIEDFEPSSESSQSESSSSEGGGSPRGTKRKGSPQPGRASKKASQAAARPRPSTPLGWMHLQLPRESKESRRDRLRSYKNSSRHRDAYPTLHLPLADDSKDNPYAKEPLRSKTKAYLGSLLMNMFGAAGHFSEKTQELNHLNVPNYGHYHHHHRPNQTILDHKWRLQYFIELRPDRFPWPEGAERDCETMISTCESLRAAKEEKDPKDAIEWRGFGTLLDHGEKTTRLWETRPLEGNQTMRCLSGNCENLRKYCLEFEQLEEESQEKVSWKLFDKYQRWRYGAQRCPKDCPLRPFDCPKGCKEVHESAIGISWKQALVYRNQPLELDKIQLKKVKNQITDKFPSRWEGAPPYHFMPVRASADFWDPENDSVTATRARIDACSNRLKDWFVLTDEDRRAILKSEEVYFHDMDCIAEDAKWGEKGKEARKRALKEVADKTESPEYTNPLPLHQAVQRHMKRKLDETTLYLRKGEREETWKGTFYRKLPKQRKLEENSSARLKEFW